MNIAICDDLQAHNELLQKYVELYFVNHGLDLKLSCFLSGEAFLNNFMKNEYEIVFLDIYMSGKSGMEVAHAIRDAGSKSLIIFTTTSLDHAIESYEVQAVHYLVKPLSYANVEKALDRCQKLFTEADKYIEIKSERIMVRILLKELIYAEVYSNVTVLHTVSSDIKTYMSLNELELLLPGEEFLRCHRSYIVNMNFIAGNENCDFILKSNQKVPIRRQDKIKMKQLYADYLFNYIRRRHDNE